MRTAILLLVLLTTAASAETDQHSTADYVSAFEKARTYALSHPVTNLRAPSCRQAIGTDAARALLARCSVVAGGTTHMYCTRSMPCEAILDRLASYCLVWKADVPCVYEEDGGELRVDPELRGNWRPVAAAR